MEGAAREDFRENAARACVNCCWACCKRSRSAALSGGPAPPELASGGAGAEGTGNSAGGIGEGAPGGGSRAAGTAAVARPRAATTLAFALPPRTEAHLGVFALEPDWATWDVATTRGSALRGVSPEATVTLDGIQYNVGGLVPLAPWPYRLSCRRTADDRL